MQFEGFTHNDASTGASTFHPKHSPTKMSAQAGALPPGHPTFGKGPRKVKSKPIANDVA